MEATTVLVFVLLSMQQYPYFHKLGLAGNGWSVLSVTRQRGPV